MCALCVLRVLLDLRTLLVQLARPVLLGLHTRVARLALRGTTMGGTINVRYEGHSCNYWYGWYGRRYARF